MSIMKIDIQSLLLYIKKAAMIPVGLLLSFYFGFKRFQKNFFVFAVLLISDITTRIYIMTLNCLQYFFRVITRIYTLTLNCLNYFFRIIVKTNIKSLTFNIVSKPTIQSCSYVTAFISIILILVMISLYVVKITILSHSIYSGLDTDYNQQRNEVNPHSKLEKDFTLSSNDNLITNVETNKDKTDLYLYMKRNNNEITIRQEDNLKYSELDASSIIDFSVHKDTGVILENTKKVYQTNNHLVSKKKRIDFSGKPPSSIFSTQKYFNSIIAVEPKAYSLFTYDIDSWVWKILIENNKNQKYSNIMFFDDFFLRWNDHYFNTITPKIDNTYDFGKEEKIDDAIVDISYDQFGHKLFFMTKNSILEYDINKKNILNQILSSQFSGSTIKGARKYNNDLFLVTDKSLNRYILKDRQWVHSDLNKNLINDFNDFYFLEENIVLINDNGVFLCPLKFHEVSQHKYERLKIEQETEQDHFNYQNYFSNGNDILFFYFSNRIYKLHKNKDNKLTIDEEYNYCKNNFFQNHQASEVQDVFYIRPSEQGATKNDGFVQYAIGYLQDLMGFNDNIGYTSLILLTDKSILSYSPTKRCGKKVSGHYDDAIFNNNTLYYLKDTKLHIFTGENPEIIKTIEKYNIESFDIYKNKTSILHNISGHNEIISYGDNFQTEQNNYFRNKWDITFDQLIYLYQNNNLLYFFDKEGYQAIDMKTFSASPKKKYPSPLSNKYKIKRFDDTDDFALINYDKPYIFSVYTDDAKKLLTTKTHRISKDFRMVCKRGNQLVLQTQDGLKCTFISIDKKSIKHEVVKTPLYPFLKENIIDIYATQNDLIFLYKKENHNKVYKYSPHQLLGEPIDFRNITIDDSNFSNVINYNNELFGINGGKIYNISKGKTVFTHNTVMDFDRHEQQYIFLLLKDQNNSLMLGQKKFLNATFHQFNNNTKAYKIDNYLYMISDNRVYIIDYTALSLTNQKDYKLIKSTLPYKKNLYVFAEEKNGSKKTDSQKKLVIDCFTQGSIKTVYNQIDSNDYIFKKNIKGYVKTDISSASIYDYDSNPDSYEMTLLDFYRSSEIKNNIQSIENTKIKKVFYDNKYLYMFNKNNNDNKYSYAVYDTKNLIWINYGEDVSNANFINNKVWIKKDDQSSYLDGNGNYLPNGKNPVPYEYQKPYSVINENNINYFKKIKKDISLQTIDTIFSSNDVIVLKQDSDVLCYTIKTRNWGVIRNDVNELYVKQKNSDTFSAYMFTQNKDTQDKELFLYQFGENGCSKKSKPYKYDQYHFSDSIVLKQYNHSFSKNGIKTIDYVMLDDNLKEKRRQVIPQFEMDKISNVFLINDYFYITGSFGDENRMLSINTSIKHNNYNATKITWEKPEYFLFNKQLYVHDKEEKKLYQMNNADKGNPIQSQISSFSYGKKNFLFLKNDGSIIVENNGKKSEVFFDYRIPQNISYYCPFGENTLLLFGNTEFYRYDYQRHTLLNKYPLNQEPSSDVKYLFFEPDSKNKKQYLLRLTMTKEKKSVTNAMLLYNDSQKFNPINIQLNSKDLSIKSYCLQNSKLYFLTEQGIDVYNTNSGKHKNRFKFQARRTFVFEFLGKNYVVLNNNLVQPLNQERQTLFTSMSDFEKIYKIDSSYYFLGKNDRLYKCNGLTDSTMEKKYPDNQLTFRNQMYLNINVPFYGEFKKKYKEKKEKIIIYQIHSKQYTVNNNKLFEVNIKPDADKEENPNIYDMSDVELKEVQSLIDHKSKSNKNIVDFDTKNNVITFNDIKGAFDRLVVKDKTIYSTSSKYTQLKYDFKNVHYFKSKSNQSYTQQEWGVRKFAIFFNEGKISVRKNKDFILAPYDLIVSKNKKLLFDNMLEVGINPLNNESFAIGNVRKSLFHLNSMTYNLNKKYKELYSNGDRLYVIDSDKNVFEMDKNNRLNQIDISENDIQRWIQQDINFGKTFSATESLSITKKNILRFHNKKIELNKLKRFDFITKDEFELSAQSELIFNGDKNQLIKYLNPFSYEVLEHDDNNQSKKNSIYLQKYSVTINLKDNKIERHISDKNYLFERQSGKKDQLIQETNFEKLHQIIKLNNTTYFFTNRYIYHLINKGISIVDNTVGYSSSNFMNGSTLLSNIVIETKDPKNGRIKKFIINEKGELAKYQNEAILIKLFADPVMELTHSKTTLIHFDNKNYQLKDISFKNNLLGLFSFIDFCYLPDKNDILFVNDSQAFKYNRDQKTFKKLKIALNKIQKIQHSSSGKIKSIHSFLDHPNDKEIVLLNKTIQYDYEDNTYTLFSVDKQNASSRLVDMYYDDKTFFTKPSDDKNFHFINKDIKTGKDYLRKLIFNSIFGIKIYDNQLFIFTEKGTFSIPYTDLDFSKIKKENDIYVQEIFKAYDYLFVKSTDNKYYQFNKGKLQPYKFKKFPSVSLVVQPQNIKTELDSSVSFDKDCIYYYNPLTNFKKQLHIQDFNSNSCLSINHPAKLTTFGDNTIYYYHNNEIFKFKKNSIKRFEFEKIHIDDFFLKNKTFVIQHKLDYFSWDGSSNEISKFLNDSKEVKEINDELLIPQYSITKNGLARGLIRTDNKPKLIVHGQPIYIFETIKPKVIFFDNDSDLNISNDLGIFKIKSQLPGYHTLLDNRIYSEPVSSKKRINDICYVSTNSKTFFFNKPESYKGTTIPYHSIKINKGKITESISSNKETFSLDDVSLETLIDENNFIFDDLENFFFDEAGNCYTFKNNFYWKQHQHTYPELIDEKVINSIISNLPLTSFSSRDLTITVSDNFQFNVEDFNLQTRVKKLKDRISFNYSDKNERVLFKSPCKCEVFTDNSFVFDTFSHIIVSDKLYWFNRSGAFSRDKWIDCKQFSKKIFGSQQFLLFDEDDSTSNVRYYYPKKDQLEEYKIKEITFDDHKWKWIFRYTQTGKTTLSFENKFNKDLDRYYSDQRLFKDDIVEKVYIDSENVKFKTNDDKIVFFDYKQNPWELKYMKNIDDTEILEDQNILDNLTDYTVQSDTFLYTIPIHKNYIEVKRIQ